MDDEHAFWAAIDAIDEALAPPPKCLPNEDSFLNRLCVNDGPAPAARPFTINAALVGFIGACVFAGAVSAAFVFHSPLERLLVR